MFLVILNWILASRRSDLTSGNSSFVWLEWEPVVVNEVFRLAGADAVGTVKCPSLAPVGSIWLWLRNQFRRGFDITGADESDGVS